MASGGSDDSSGLREFLVLQNQEWLADQLIGIAKADPVVAARLRAVAESYSVQGAAGSGRADPVVLSGLRRRLDNAIRPYAYPDYCAVSGYAHRMDELLDQVEQLTRERLPDSAIEMAEHALSLLEEAFGLIDDSGGELRIVQERAEAIHLAACEVARPDPVALGKRLATWALGSDWEIFLDAPTQYAEVLGPAGLAAFESIVDEHFLRLPQLTPQDGLDFGSWAERHRPTYLKESLAGLRGPDAVVDVIGQDLSNPYQFLRAAHVLADAGRDADALDWLARGQEAFGRSDERLTALAADLHHRSGRHVQATEITWEQFSERPSLASYERLHDFASAANEWTDRRRSALDVLRAQPIAGEPRQQPIWAEPAGHSTLVEVLMWEGDMRGAWDAAQHGGCSRRLWLELARARAIDRPADAIPVLRREIQLTIGGGKRAAYRAGAELAKELADYAQCAGQFAEFAAWILAVRKDNSRRPALQEEFNIAGLPRAPRPAGSMD